MNPNISKLGAQLRDMWRQLGVAQRVSVGIATLALVLGLGGLAFWSSRTDYSLLYGSLADGEAAKVVAALDEAKVPYKLSGGGGTVLVPADKVAFMRMQLAGKGIPNGGYLGFEIMDRQNFGISDYIQRANYQRGLQGELARTISQWNDIEAARVMVVQPENRVILDKDQSATASVFLRVRGNAQLPTQTINAIRFFVAGSVQGLKPNHVTVVDNLGNMLSENNDNDSLSGLTATQLGVRRNLEDYLAKKAQGMLERVLGPGLAIVKVSADINYDTVTHSEERYNPEGAVLRSSTKTDEKNESATASVSTPAGISANTSTETNGASSTGPLNNTRTSKGVTQTTYELSKSTSNVVVAAGGLKRLSAAVTVAARMEGTGTARKVAPRKPEELDDLRMIVASAVGIQTGTDNSRGDTIVLKEMQFNDQLATEAAQEFTQQQKQEFWWNLARNAVYPAMGLAALFVLWRLFKRTPVQEIPLGVPVGKLMAGQQGSSRAYLSAGGDAEGGSVVTVDVLNRLIKENPANMTQAIREWLDKGRAAQS